MATDDAKTFMIEDARLVFRNFSGKEGQYNREGDRNFAVILDPAVAEEMLSDGWNVKFLSSREEGEPDTPYIQVSVQHRDRFLAQLVPRCGSDHDHSWWTVLEVD